VYFSHPQVQALHCAAHKPTFTSADGLKNYIEVEATKSDTIYHTDRRSDQRLTYNSAKTLHPNYN